uniref:Uncharacterized protein n=1 Tax=Panagrolaimus sp. ES5 TaxID=591445 RepID=A0AC34GCW3_9BILA
MTNRHVIPYNAYLLLKYQCHANLEFVGSQKLLVKSVHLPKKNPVVIPEELDPAEITEASISRMEKTMLTEFFTLCENDSEARKYTYDEIGYHY